MYSQYTPPDAASCRDNRRGQHSPASVSEPLATVKIGCQLPQGISDFQKLSEIALNCEKLGYDSVWTYDHLSPFWTKHGEGLEGWTLLAAIAQRTSTIKVGTLVTNVNLRKPALLAKMASTVDNLSGGRLILGLGTGDRLSRVELESHGYRFEGLNDRIGRLRETILILKSLWTEDLTSFNGRHYRLAAAASYPKPIQRPHPPIWVGGRHPRILEVAAELADGWNHWGVAPNRLPQMEQYLDTRCEQFGRRPESITKSWAGQLRNLSEIENGGSSVVEKVRVELRNQTSPGTDYLIATLGPRVELSSYEVFAEAAESVWNHGV